VSYASHIKSELKMSILRNLLESEQRLSDLKEKIQTQETTIAHALKELEQIDITTKSRGVYRLTPLGVLEAQICIGCSLSFDVLEKYKEFWLTHDTSAIPPILMRNLGAIEKSLLIKSTSVDLQKVHNNFIEILLTSKTLYGISPIFHPDFINAFREILSKGNKIQLVVNNDVLEKIKQDANDLLTKYLSEGNLQVFLNDNLKLALTITENSWSLGLFNIAGEYDYTNDLVGNEKDGLDWGYKLFKEILEQSTPYT
jgi:predicted transcriptional regulator